MACLIWEGASAILVRSLAIPCFILKWLVFTTVVLVMHFWQNKIDKNRSDIRQLLEKVPTSDQSPGTSQVHMTQAYSGNRHFQVRFYLNAKSIIQFTLESKG